MQRYLTGADLIIQKELLKYNSNNYFIKAELHPQFICQSNKDKGITHKNGSRNKQAT